VTTSGTMTRSQIQNALRYFDIDITPLEAVAVAYDRFVFVIPSFLVTPAAIAGAVRSV
jgi:hypothetical protein